MKHDIVIGDWSDDGHGKTRRITIESNLEEYEIVEAEKKANKILGFSFSKDVAADYEDRSLSDEFQEKLTKNGIKNIHKFSLNKKGEEFELDTESYFKLWCEIIKLGNKDFEYVVINGNQINIGGYGLFQ